MNTSRTVLTVVAMLVIAGCGSGVLEPPKESTTADLIMDPCYWCNRGPTLVDCQDCCYSCGERKCEIYCGNTPWWDAQECVRCLQQEVGKCIGRECRDKY